jgi:type I restriction enzyme S subunit
MNEVNGHKKNGILKTWKAVQLKDIVSVLGDGLHGTPIYSDDGEYFFINGNNLEDGKIVLKENTKRVSFEEYKRLRKELNDRTILVSINGTIGNVAFYNNEKVILGKSACYFNVLDNVDKKFLKLLLSSRRFLNYAFGTATGSTIKNVSLKAMREFPILLPSLSEQQQIVSEIEELFSELDKSIEQLKTAQQQLKVYRQSVLKWAFEGKFTNENVKDGELMEGWNKRSLKEIKQFSLYGPRFSSKDYATDGVAILRTSDIDESGKVDWFNAPKLMLTDSEFEKYQLIKGDLLITRTGSIGTISVFNDSKKAIPGAFLIHYRLAKDVNPWFIFYFLKTKEAQDHFKSYSFGVGRPNLNVPNIELLLIPIPPLEEQQKVLEEIENRLSVADKLEETITNSLQQAEALRQSILKKAFEGQI